MEQRVVATAWETWEQAGLPEINEYRCQTERFEVRFPTIMQFDTLCYPGTTKTVNGCFRWLRVERRGQTIRETIHKPVAVIDPTMPDGVDVEALALHEIRHGLIDCVLKRPASDPFDKDHTIAAVWGAGNASLPCVAMARLEAP